MMKALFTFLTLIFTIQLHSFEVKWEKKLPEKPIKSRWTKHYRNVILFYGNGLVELRDSDNGEILKTNKFLNNYGANWQLSDIEAQDDLDSVIVSYYDSLKKEYIVIRHLQNKVNEVMRYRLDTPIGGEVSSNFELYNFDNDNTLLHIKMKKAINYNSISYVTIDTGVTWKMSKEGFVEKLPINGNIANLDYQTYDSNYVAYFDNTIIPYHPFFRRYYSNSYNLTKQELKIDRNYGIRVYDELSLNYSSVAEGVYLNLVFNEARLIFKNKDFIFQLPTYTITDPMFITEYAQKSYHLTKDITNAIYIEPIYIRSEISDFNLILSKRKSENNSFKYKVKIFDNLNLLYSKIEPKFIHVYSDSIKLVDYSQIMYDSVKIVNYRKILEEKDTMTLLASISDKNIKYDWQINEDIYRSGNNVKLNLKKGKNRVKLFAENKGIIFIDSVDCFVVDNFDKIVQKYWIGDSLFYKLKIAKEVGLSFTFGDTLSVKFIKVDSTNDYYYYYYSSINKSINIPFSLRYKSQVYNNIIPKERLAEIEKKDNGLIDFKIISSLLNINGLKDNSDSRSYYITQYKDNVNFQDYFSDLVFRNVLIFSRNSKLSFLKQYSIDNSERVDMNLVFKGDLENEIVIINKSKDTVVSKRKADSIQFIENVINENYDPLYLNTPTELNLTPFGFSKINYDQTIIRRRKQSFQFPFMLDQTYIKLKSIDLFNEQNKIFKTIDLTQSIKEYSTNYRLVDDSLLVLEYNGSYNKYLNIYTGNLDSCEIGSQSFYLGKYNLYDVSLIRQDTLVKIVLSDKGVIKEEFIGDSSYKFNFALKFNNCIFLFDYNNESYVYFNLVNGRLNRVGNNVSAYRNNGVAYNYRDKYLLVYSHSNRNLLVFNKDLDVKKLDITDIYKIKDAGNNRLLLFQNSRVYYDNLYNSVKNETNVFLTKNIDEYLDALFANTSSENNNTINPPILHPNPASDYINLQELGNYEIFSSTGEFIANGVNIDGKVNTENLPTGIYFVKINSKSYKFIKE